MVYYIHDYTHYYTNCFSNTRYCSCSSSKSGDGIEGALGGGFQTTSVKQKRRGMEKFFFFTLIAVSLLFVISILYSLVNPTL